MKVSKETFEEWLENPVTESVLKVLENYSRAAESEVKAQMWAADFLSPEQQANLSLNKGMAMLAHDISELTFEAYEQFSEDKA